MLNRLKSAIETVLEWVTLALMIVLTITVIVAVFYRIAGNSLSWYDEIAAIQLSWITYYGAALAALKRRHIGMDLVLLSIPMPLRLYLAVLAEVIVLGFFALMAYYGWQVLVILHGETLVSLTWIPIQLTQSVIPIGGALFVICQLLSMPEYLRFTAKGVSLEHAEIEEEVEVEMKKAEAMRAESASKGGRG